MKKLEDRIVDAIGHGFSTFGGNREVTDGNPIAAAMKGKPPMFAAGVDVRTVVRFVIAVSRKKPRVGR